MKIFKLLIVIFIIVSSIDAFSQADLIDYDDLLIDSTGIFGVLEDGPSLPRNSDLVSNYITDDILENNNKSSGGESGSLGRKGQVLFPSPNSASLLNLEKEDVNLYLGKINQNFPLFNFKSYDISVPITLNYSSSGIKLTDIASWVGLGWNLKPGGQIIRLTKGLPDEYSGTVKKRNGQTIQAFGYKKLVEKIDKEGYNSYNFMSKVGVTTVMSYDQQEELIKNSMLFNKETEVAWDTQPDFFYYNFGGYSGKFVFNNLGEIISIPDNNFEITYNIKEFTENHDSPVSSFIGTFNEENTYSIITGFTVKTEDGYTYIFGSDNLSAVEISCNLTYTKYFPYKHKNISYGLNERFIDVDGFIYYYLNNEPSVNYDVSGENNKYSFSLIPEYSSTWHLKKIISPRFNTVDFNYTKGAKKLAYIENKGEQMQISNDTFVEFTNILKSRFEETYETLSINRTIVFHDDLVLESINGSNGCRVEFFAEADRMDLLNAKRLKHIEIYDNTSNNGQLIKKFEFKHDDIVNDGPKFIKYRVRFYATDNSQYFSDAPIYAALISINEGPYKSSERTRMYLSEFIESSPDDELKKTYKFDYINKNLPPRFSPQKDLFGYFNNSQSFGHIHRYPEHRDVGWAAIYNIDGEDKEYVFTEREKDEESMKAGLLQMITYPTGGTKEFKYESNTINIGGSRIESIINNFGENNSNTITYSYVGNTSVTPDNHVHSYDRTDLYEYINLKTVVINTLANNYIPSNIGYDTVVVEKGLGKTKFAFKSYNSKPDSYKVMDGYEGLWKSNGSSPPYRPSIDKSWQRSLLSDIKTYTNEDENNPIRHVHNEYDFSTYPSMVNHSLVSDYYKLIPIEIKPWTITVTKKEEEPPFNTYTEDKEGQRFFVKEVPLLKILRARFIQHNSDNYKLAKTITKDYDITDLGNEEKAIVNVKEYGHNSKLFVTSIEGYSGDADGNRLSTSDIYKTLIKYPMDFPNEGVLNTMANDPEFNMQNYPIETIKYKNNKAIESTITSYKQTENSNSEEAGLIMPFETYSLETVQPVLDYTSSAPNFDPAEICKVQGSFDEYDDKGNLLQYHKTNGLYTSYLWAYNQSYPIAKVENSTYEDLKAAIESSGSSIEEIETKSMGSTDEVDLFNIFNNLRNDDLMSDAIITSYTYDPLIGMKSETDANGKTTYYEYDGLGRLKLVRDDDSNILKKYEYKYK